MTVLGTIKSDAADLNTRHKRWAVVATRDRDAEYVRVALEAFLVKADGYNVF